MAVEYYVMKRVKGRKEDVKIRTCETSLQAHKHIDALPKGDRTQYYVQYSQDAIREYQSRIGA